MNLLIKKGIEDKNKASLWLALFIGLGGLYICPFMFGYANWYSQDGYREFLYFVPFQQLFLIGPVFYFYVRSLLNSEEKLYKKDFLHFLPAFAYLGYSLIVFITDVFILDAYYFYSDGRDKDLDFWYQMAGLLSMLFYLVVSLKFYFNYRRLSLQELSFADDIAYKWIKHFAVAFTAVLLLRVLFFILNPEWGQFGRKYWYYLCFSILFFFIAIQGYINTIKTSLPFRTIGPVNMNTSDIEDSIEVVEEEVVHEDQAKKERLVDLFEQEEVYKNPNLTLTDVAHQLGTNRNIISKIINQTFEMNFNDFVNQKRAMAVIDKLKRGEHSNRTILSLALDSGFNSKTTFNRAFKKYAGLSPKQYIEKNSL